MEHSSLCVAHRITVYFRTHQFEVGAPVQFAEQCDASLLWSTSWELSEQLSWAACKPWPASAGYSWTPSKLDTI